ncbi:MAG: FMN-binding protein [Planctomycetes bacterium]|nr:FMN-binding protein [Planctomycetota bacterium]
MTDTVRYPLVLGLIALASAAALAFSYALTRDEIRRQAALEKDRGLAAVFGLKLDEKAKERPWREERPGVFAATGRALYAATGGARGYSGKVEVIAAVDAAVRTNYDAARVKAMRVIVQTETPGLGDKCRSPEFQKQFEELLLGRLEVKRGAPYRVPGTPGSDQQEIAAITGATITSNAVIAAVQEAIDRICQGAPQEPSDGSPKRD